MTGRPLGLGEERVDPGEETLARRITDANARMMKRCTGAGPCPTVFERAQHPKGHGCFAARFTVRGDIPEAQRIGLFARPGAHDALVRFSNGLSPDDSKRDAHGLGIKVLGVGGEKFEPDPQERYRDSHDFVLIDNAAFFARALMDYVHFNEEVGRVIAAKRSGGDLRKWLSGFGGLLRFMTRPGGLRMLKASKRFAGQRPRSLIDSDFWSVTPYLLGEGQAVKYALHAAPSPLPIDLTGGVEGADGLTEALRRHLSIVPARYTFGVHVQTDPQRHPVEDSSVDWEAEGAPFVPLADLEILKVPAEDTAPVPLGEAFTTNPWNALPEHRPLGNVNRARRIVYRTLARQRLGLPPEAEAGPVTAPAPAEEAPAAKGNAA